MRTWQGHGDTSVSRLMSTFKCFHRLQNWVPEGNAEILMMYQRKGSRCARQCAIVVRSNELNCNVQAVSKTEVSGVAGICGTVDRSLRIMIKPKGLCKEGLIIIVPYTTEEGFTMDTMP